MRIGARIIKTGIAVTITMYICRALGLEPAFFGAVSAVVNMQPSIYLTFRTARDQILIHVIGVAAGIGSGFALGGTPLVMGLVSILLISLYIRLNLQSGITTGIVAALFVLGMGEAEFYVPHALDRTAVIFAGLGTAMIINILLWPPRHGRQFAALVDECNRAAVDYFCQAVDEYIRLENDQPEMNARERERVHRLLGQARDLSELARREGETASGAEPGFMQVGRMLDYTESLAEKADRIYDLLPARLERRRAAGSPPISPEFRAILEMLRQGCDTVIRVNGKLRDVVIRGRDSEPEEIREDYWERMSQAIENWQPKLAGSYYLHALMEVSVTASEIRWGARSAKKLLSESMAGGSEF